MKILQILQISHIVAERSGIDVELEAHAWIAIKLSFSINGIFSF